VTRRGLFGILASAAAAAVLDPERALWLPGRKLISIPAPPAFKRGDRIRIPVRYYPEYSRALERFERDRLELISRQLWPIAGELEQRTIVDPAEAARLGVRVGHTLATRKPPRFVPFDDPARIEFQRQLVRDYDPLFRL
jgi:hypothetical protein